ncbi:MAG TPA: AAA family ATPase, partial [Firmicutes bacterium]|nr:AAA family ATPase [Bacillota bacterium]
MLLKALEIQGFKSFPDKTRLEYSQGLTAIVGPNGSGKSNISDAVRWVMGEQSTKTLRGAKMEDVIFIGTKSRKSQGVAQVSLTFDNTDRSLGVDSDEVTVTRKYYRSGESEYLINKAPVRLKDINELFMDTGLGKDGYSLVGQGKIAEIISAKSTERREIFEEAAGISKLRYRKQESERRLQMAEENLVRLRDILSELEGRVEPLRIQSEKAEKFLQLSADKKRTELSLWLCSLDRLRQMLRSQEDKIIVSTQVKEQIQEEIDAVEEEIRQTYQQMQNCDIETDTFTREREQLDQQTAEGRSQIAVYQNDIEHHEENIGRAEEELSTYQRSHQEMEADIVAKREQEQAIAADIQQIREQIAKEEAELLQLRGQGDDTRRQADQLTAELNELTLHRSQYQMLIASAQNHMEELKNRQAVFEQNRAERQTAFEQAGKELAELKEAESLAEETRLSLQNTRKGYQLKLESRHQKLQTAQAACNQLDTEMKEKKQHA